MRNKDLILGSEYRDKWGYLNEKGWQEISRRKGKLSGLSRRERVFLRDTNIIEALWSGETQSEVAKQFGVNQSTVSRVLKRWRSANNTT